LYFGRFSSVHIGGLSANQMAFLEITQMIQPTQEVLKRTLSKEINAGVADPKLKSRFSELGAEVLLGSPADFAKLIADDTVKWAKVVRAANIRAD
jgi:tripartite-type tricarboxylate transporter receptor subunit TctC